MAERPVDVSVVIPAYNEAAPLEEVLRQVVAYFQAHPWSFEVIVVDDASRDETRAIVEAWASRDPRIRVVSLARNRGKGYAVKAGMLVAQGEVALFMDADNSTSIEEFTRFWPHLKNGCDMVIASRWLPAARIEIPQPWHRQFLGVMAHLLSRRFIGGGLTDYSCGFKAFSRTARTTLFPLLRIHRWMIDHELIWLARTQGFRIQEVPVHWRDRAASKVRPLRDSLRCLVDLARIRLNAALGRYRAPRRDA